MPREAAAQRAAKRDQRERHDCCREHDMRGEEREISRPDQTLAAETHVADVVMVDAVEMKKATDTVNALIMHTRWMCT